MEDLKEENPNVDNEEGDPNHCTSCLIFCVRTTLMDIFEFSICCRTIDDIFSCKENCEDKFARKSLFYVVHSPPPPLPLLNTEIVSFFCR